MLTNLNVLTLSISVPKELQSQALGSCTLFPCSCVTTLGINSTENHGLYWSEQTLYFTSLDRLHFFKLAILVAAQNQFKLSPQM